jgi:hypothetical protein
MSPPVSSMPELATRWREGRRSCDRESQAISVREETNNTRDEGDRHDPDHARSHDANQR